MSENSASCNVGGCFSFLLFLLGLYFCIVFFDGCSDAPNGEGLRGGTKAVVSEVRSLWAEAEPEETE